MAGLQSYAMQRRAGVLTRTGSAGYIWTGGYQPTNSPNLTGNQFFYPWGFASNVMTCSAASAPMIAVRHSENGAFGCHDKTFTSAFGLCCLNEDW